MFYVLMLTCWRKIKFLAWYVEENMFLTLYFEKKHKKLEIFDVMLWKNYDVFVVIFWREKEFLVWGCVC